MIRTGYWRGHSNMPSGALSAMMPVLNCSNRFGSNRFCSDRSCCDSLMMIPLRWLPLCTIPRLVEYRRELLDPKAAWASVETFQVEIVQSVEETEANDRKWLWFPAQIRLNRSKSEISEGSSAKRTPDSVDQNYDNRTGRFRSFF